MRKSSVIAFTRKKPAVFLFFPAVITMVFFKITGLLSSVSFFRNSLLLAAGVLTAHSFQGTKRTANSKTVNDRSKPAMREKETVDGSTGTAGEIFFCIDLNDWRFSYIIQRQKRPWDTRQGSVRQFRGSSLNSLTPVPPGC